MERIPLLLVGTGGYAGAYVDELLHKPRARRFQLVGAVDPYAAQSSSGRELIESGVPVYDTLEEFYGEHRAQLAFLVTPICLHARQAEYCMEHGSDVLCEKPLSGSLKEAGDMMAARDRTGRRLAVGFQWSFSEGILQLKRDILNGVYGKIRRIRTLVYFPRNLDYYHRGTGWAGKRRLDTGEWILDSVASNAAAHYLHNMLFLTGKQTDQSAKPEKMEAEVYRANAIEMFDTCALRIYTDEGTELLFYASHAIPYEEPYDNCMEFILEGEKGTVAMRGGKKGESMVGQQNGGERILYPAPGSDNMRKLYCMADAVQKGSPLPCVPETALPHLKCISALADSFPQTPKFPEEWIRYVEKDRQYICEGLGEILRECYLEGRLPWELRDEKHAAWSEKPHEINMKNRGNQSAG